MHHTNGSNRTAPGAGGGVGIGGGSRYFRALMDSLLDAVVIADDQGVIWGYNQAAHQLFGYAPSEVLGRHVALLVPSTCWRADAALDARFSSGAAAEAGRQRLAGRRKDGTAFHCLLDLTAFVVDDRRYVVGVARELAGVPA
jgi:sigma-B regulation protein RsbU (phosphoserine phosphatase)